jgi:hypothetical protein
MNFIFSTATCAQCGAHRGSGQTHAKSKWMAQDLIHFYFSQGFHPHFAYVHIFTTTKAPARRAKTDFYFREYRLEVNGCCTRPQHTRQHQRWTSARVWKNVLSMRERNARFMTRVIVEAIISEMTNHTVCGWVDGWGGLRVILFCQRASATRTRGVSLSLCVALALY